MRNKFDLPDICRRTIHPFLLKAMPGRRNFDIEVLNDMPEVAGNKLFAINHSCSNDMPVASEVIKEHFYILLGKQRLEIIDRIFFFLNGVVYVDRKNKKDRAKSLQRMLKILRDGKSLIIFPEGTWNITPSKPMLPLNWGIIELAKQTGVPIIPLILEYHPDCCYAKYGDAIYIDADADKLKEIEKLEDAMATLKWDIWELTPTGKRNNEMKTEFEQMIQQRIVAYPKLDVEYELSVVRARI